MISTNTEMTRPPDPGHPESHESVSTRCDGDDPHPYMDGSSASWGQSCMTGTTYARTQHAVYCHTHIQAIQTTRWTVMCRMVSWDGPRSRDPEIPRSRDHQIPRSRDDQIHKMDGRVYGSTDYTHSRDARARQGIDVCKGDSHSCLRTATRTSTPGSETPGSRDHQIRR